MGSDRIIKKGKFKSDDSVRPVSIHTRATYYAKFVLKISDRPEMYAKALELEKEYKELSRLLKCSFMDSYIKFIYFSNKQKDPGEFLCFDLIDAIVNVTSLCYGSSFIDEEEYDNLRALYTLLNKKFSKEIYVSKQASFKQPGEKTAFLINRDGGLIFDYKVLATKLSFSLDVMTEPYKIACVTRPMLDFTLTMFSKKIGNLEVLKLVNPTLALRSVEQFSFSKEYFEVMHRAYWYLLKKNLTKEFKSLLFCHNEALFSGCVPPKTTKIDDSTLENLTTLNRKKEY